MGQGCLGFKFDASPEVDLPGTLHHTEAKGISEETHDEVAKIVCSIGTPVDDVLSRTFAPGSGIINGTRTPLADIIHRTCSPITNVFRCTCGPVADIGGGVAEPVAAATLAGRRRPLAHRAAGEVLAEHDAADGEGADHGGADGDLAACGQGMVLLLLHDGLHGLALLRNRHYHLGSLGRTRWNCHRELATGVVGVVDLN
mmetsp:Transcript_27656/g.70997  ORF Transcript_27656/g.70997 Transcript_27656/m.70997 type:complete len:200 (-) Transcript_27656:591-1190(-)